MADKVANADIEDVLSSIRRLVSDETEPRDVVPPVTEDGESFLLTPALRVLPSDQPADGQVEAGTTAAEDAGTEDLRVLSGLEATVAELEAAVEEHTEFEPDGGESGSVLDYPPSLVRQAKDGPRRRLTLGLSEPGSEVEESDAPAASTAELRPASPPPLELTGNLRLVPPVEPPVDEDDSDEVLLDEDGLREMVAQIVREELRGSLGEQITANIRKLIRREIHDYFDVRDGE